MAFIKDFRYDIFISYAHVDNLPTSWENLGWIEKFYKDLDTLLTRRIGRPGVIKIWWDNRKLDGSILFDDSIEEGIRESAIMICLNSPSYVSSDYCKKELDLFYSKARQEPVGLKVANRSRILNVLLYNIPHNEWAPALSGTSGFAFHDAKEDDDYGDPLDIASPEFRNKLQDIRDAIIKLVNDFPKEIKPAPVLEELKKEKEKKEGFTIYMGEVADTLRTARKRIISELEKKGYNLEYGVPPPDEAFAHEQKVKEQLQHADLAVHLLDEYPGREIAGVQDEWYPQKQSAISLQFAKSKLIWVPAETNLELIEEEKYKLFLQGLEEGKASANSYEYIRGAKSTLAQEIADIAEQTKLQQQKQTVKEKISVLLDTHFNDQLYAFDLSKTLLENQIQPFINPQEDDPRKNINILGDRISQVTKLIFFYGKVSREWVLERMSAALQLIITNNYPIEEFYIYMAPPHKNL
ncbi:MAG: toll/interleukin-1 receptor domain-containing protein, partial [Ginsengibacter sp.]